MTDAEYTPLETLHSRMIDTLNQLNMQILELAVRGCDVCVQVLGIDDNLRRPKSKPEIVVRVTHLVGYTAPTPAEVRQFRPNVIDGGQP